jgi:Rps23 Pro-64 3,4-dihydroxylase Tpa1-like proline 4-hydroxylase
MDSKDSLRRALEQRLDLTNVDLTSPDIVNRWTEEFAKAEPFPHIVIDGLFKETFLELIVEEFAALSSHKLISYDTRQERHIRSHPDDRLPPATQAYFDTIYSGWFVRFLSQLTGIQGLVTDPNLRGGGMNVSPTGGHFQVHIDFQKHHTTKLDNRFAMITYLNRGWKPEYGGLLELWRPDLSACGATIVPEFGRTIIFLQSPRAPHGVPAKVAAPNDEPRKSLTAYYYSNGAPSGQSGPELTTRFVGLNAMPTARKRVTTVIKKLAPPILLDLVRAIRRR